MECHVLVGIIAAGFTVAVIMFAVYHALTRRIDQLFFKDDGGVRFDDIIEDLTEAVREIAKAARHHE